MHRLQCTQKVVFTGDQPKCYEQSCHCVLKLGIQLHTVFANSCKTYCTPKEI